MCNFPTLNQYKIENMNIPIINNENESVIKKNLPTNTSPGPDGFSGEFYKAFNTYSSQTISRNRGGRNVSELILWGQHHPDTKTRQSHQKQENYRLVSLMNTDAKILNKILANQIQQYIKRIMYHNQVGFMPGMQGFFSICKSLWYITLINWIIKIIWSS